MSLNGSLNVSSNGSLIVSLNGSLNVSLNNEYMSPQIFLPKMEWKLCAKWKTLASAKKEIICIL